MIFANHLRSLVLTATQWNYADTGKTLITRWPVIVGAQPRDRSINKPCGYPTDKQSGMVSIISEDVRGSLRQVIADSYVTDE